MQDNNYFCVSLKKNVKDFDSNRFFNMVATMSKQKP